MSIMFLGWVVTSYDEMGNSLVCIVNNAVSFDGTIAMFSLTYLPFILRENDPAIPSKQRSRKK
jgi:hypothetical protein